MEIPSSVSSFYGSALQGCNALKSLILNCKNVYFTSTSKHFELPNLKYLEIGKEVATLDSTAFTGCDNLESISFHCKHILTWFKGFKTLKEIILGKELYRFEDDAFTDCTNLTSVVLYTPYVGDWFKTIVDNNNLSSIYIGNSVSRIENYSFAYSSNLSSIIVDENNPVYDSRDNCNAIILKSSNKLVKGCKNTQIPNSIV
ncbi:MAG: leucine-rich repeat domain-containing protein [Prevotella sp.]|nr:leucine-rich repeat domain-containing protein [Prevotella sp.]